MAGAVSKTDTIYLRTLATLCGFSAIFFLEFFPPEFDYRLVARSH